MRAANGCLWNMRSSQPCEAVSDERLSQLCSSYLRLTGKELAACADQASLRRALWLAPRAIVAHGVEADPVFFYGNLCALQLFEMDFARFCRLPSRLSAQPLAQAERARLLERVARQGYVDDYSGVRVTGSGKRFLIEAATVWNLQDSAGNYCGQAATFSDWRAL